METDEDPGALPLGSEWCAALLVAFVEAGAKTPRDLLISGASANLAVCGNLPDALPFLRLLAAPFDERRAHNGEEEAVCARPLRDACSKCAATFVSDRPLLLRTLLATALGANGSRDVATAADTAAGIVAAVAHSLVAADGPSPKKTSPSNSSRMCTAALCAGSTAAGR